jgi:hypothetical protein
MPAGGQVRSGSFPDSSWAEEPGDIISPDLPAGDVMPRPLERPALSLLPMPT